MAGNTVRQHMGALPIRLVDTKTSNVVSHTAPEAGTVFYGKLTADYIDDIIAIERASFPAPWSMELLLRTLEQRVAFNLGIFVLDGDTPRLAGYSYNYLVVDELHILNIAVSPEHRGMGYGRALLCEVLAQAIERGAVYAMLEVRVTNFVAQGLYASLGFKVGGMRRRYYRDNGEDALVLERRLAKDDLAKLR